MRARTTITYNRITYLQQHQLRRLLLALLTKAPWNRQVAHGPMVVMRVARTLMLLLRLQALQRPRGASSTLTLKWRGRQGQHRR